MCSSYLDRLAEEVNDKLQEAGLISVAELCKSYDLPGDFLTEVGPYSSFIAGFVCEERKISPPGFLTRFRSCPTVSGN